jgi:hypothetical protein
MFHFNTYTIGLELGFLKDYCIRHGEMKKFSRGDLFETEGMCTHRIGYITKGHFKYIVKNEAEGKNYISGFAFCGEFVADFPNCMKCLPAVVSIVAMDYSEVYIINGEKLLDIIDNQVICHIYERLFEQIYSQYLDTYRITTRERYKRLLFRCPQIVQSINLKDIASYLRVTPTTISNIRREITFGL